MKDFFERVWQYQAKNMTLRFYVASINIPLFLDKNLAGKRRSSPSSCCCKEFVSLVQKAFRDSCNRHLVPYEVKLNPSLPCKRQRSSDSSTSDFASPSPEPEDIEVKFPASSLWDPKTRPEAFQRILLVTLSLPRRSVLRVY